MKWARRLAVVAVVLGVVAFGLGIAWSDVALPRLKQYPTDLDTTLEYEGTFTQYLDPATALPYATPKTAPMQVERRVTTEAEGVPRAARVLEQVHMRAGELIDAQYENLYVIDRRTIRNIPDFHSYAFEPSNHVDRRGYRVNMPFGMDAGTAYPVYNNETATLHEMVAADEPFVTRNGLDLVVYEQDWGPVPATDGYVRSLANAGVPASLTLEQLEGRLALVGIDYAALQRAIEPELELVDAQVLGKLQSEPVKLRYSFYASGSTAFEPRTGSIADVQLIREKLEAAPDLSSIETLRTILAKYTHVEGVPQALTGLDRLVAQPPEPVFGVEYHQTDASVAATAKLLEDQLFLLDLAEYQVPETLLVVGAALVLAGAVTLLALRRRVVPPAERPSEIDLTTPTAPPAISEAAAAESRPATATGDGPEPGSGAGSESPSVPAAPGKIPYRR